MKMNKEKMIKVCEMIRADMEQDAKSFNGRSFDGKTVAEYFGYQGAAIASLADIVRALVEAEMMK
jgi:hypothetical protein